jgi:hypothetical protein
MSYSEENGQVVLRMTREDYDAILIRLGISAAWLLRHGGTLDRELKLLNGLNSGNPHCTPSQMKAKKS